jgi:predicted type IV restriction endonuclease
MAGPLPRLAFPEGTPFDIRQRGGRPLILDRVRRRYVRLTPEEWVRQHLLRTLIEHYGYPAGLLSLEPTLRTAGGPRRPDVVAFGRDRQPVLIAECKAPGIRLDQAVFDQVSRYNTVAGAPVLLVTNGREHFCWEVDPVAGTYRFLEGIPVSPHDN